MVYQLRITVILFITCLTFFSCTRQINHRIPRDRNDLPLAYSQVKENLYLINDPNYWSTNSLIFTPPEGILFIDGTWTDKTSQQLVFHADTLSSSEYFGLVLTSHSLNRSGGLPAFQRNRIPVLVNKRTRKMILNRWQAMQREMKMSFSSWISTELVEMNDDSFADELTLMNGKVKVFFPGPGMTEDNLIVYFRDEKVLFGGELISNPPLEIFYRYKKEEILESLKKIENLDIDIVVPGHGITGNRQLIEDMKKNL
jgi:metallo-beta-lactamase class B